MGYYYDMVTWEEDEIDFKSDLRDLKIGILNGDKKFEIKQEGIEKNLKVLDFISEVFPGDIITGSLCLSLYGLINRNLNDIDLIIKDENRFTDYVKDLYGYEKKILDNRLGYKSFTFKKSFFSKRRNYKVDFFKQVDDIKTDYLIHNGVKIKIDRPVNVISHKMNMNSHKHRADLYRIFNKLN